MERGVGYHSSMVEKRKRERERERMEIYGYSINTATVYLSCFIVVGIAFSHVGKIKSFLLLLYLKGNYKFGNLFMTS